MSPPKKMKLILLFYCFVKPFHLKENCNIFLCLQIADTYQLRVNLANFIKCVFTTQMSCRFGQGERDI